MILLKLSKCDNKIVRIECTNGEIIEGICSYNSNEYNEHEYGRNEEGIQIVNFLFYKSDIRKIEVIDSFSEPYGMLEELIVKEGIDSITDVLFDEEKEHVYRLLEYLNNYFKTHEKNTFHHLNNLIKYLNKLLTYNERVDTDIQENIKINKKINELLDMLNKT